MLESQKLQLRMSELREKINTMDIGDGDGEIEYRAEDMDALTSEYTTLESRYRAAVIKESAEIEATPTGDLDSEGREVRHLESLIECRHYIEAALHETPVRGQEAEYNDSLSLIGVGTQMPWAALLSPEARAELRAATTAPSDSDTAVRSILGRVFAKSAADYLGVVSPMVPVGAANFPVLTGGTVPANAADDGAADETAATITANVLDPLRLTGSYRIRQTDINKLAMMEDSLRVDLGGALEESRDKGVIAGTGTAPEVVGFLATANAVLTDPTNPSAEATFAD